MSMTVAEIIETLDGSAAVSRATGIPLTTIEGWKQANYVPVWRQQPLVELAAKAGASIVFPPVSARRSKAQAA